MGLDRIPSLLAAYHKGVIVDAELASQFVHEVFYEPRFDPEAFVRAFHLLPEDVKQKTVAFVRKIKDAGFSYTPFLIGGKGRPVDPQRLREIFAALEPFEQRE